VDAYESDKIILDTYGEIVTLKRRRDDDEDNDEKPSAGSDRGSKRRREGKEPESASTPSETITRSAGRSTIGSKSRQASTSESALAEEPVFPVNNKTVELLTFMPPMGDSPEVMLVVVYWFLGTSTKILEVIVDEVFKWNNTTTSVVRLLSSDIRALSDFYMTPSSIHK
nr:hypothetical protein [Tanacetum cinerariifolium]